MRSTTLSFLLLLAAAGVALAAPGDPRLVAGDAFFCLLDDDGVRCWGDAVPEWPQGAIRTEPLVADGACGAHCRETARARYVVLSHPRHIAAGAYDACAFDDEGLRCFGRTAEVHQVPEARRRELPRELEIGRGFACARWASELTCWGRGRDGGRFESTATVDASGIVSGDRYLAGLFTNIPWDAATLSTEWAGVCVHGEPQPADARPTACTRVGPDARYRLDGYAMMLPLAGERVLFASGISRNPCMIETGRWGYPLSISCAYPSRLNADIDEWGRETSNIPGDHDIRELVAIGAPYAGLRACVRDSVGVRCGGVKAFREFTTEYEDRLAGATQLAFSPGFACSRYPDGSGSCDGAACALLPESVRCLGGHWDGFFDAYFTPVSLGFRLDRLDGNLRRLSDHLYADRIPVAERTAALLAEYPVEHPIDLSAPNAVLRHYVLKLLTPFMDGLTSPYVEARIKPQHAKAVAHYDAATGRTSLDRFADSADLRRAQLTLLAAGMGCLEGQAGLDDRPRFRSVIGRAAEALARGSEAGATRAALAEAAAMEPLLAALAAERSSAACGLLSLTIARLAFP